MKIEKISHIGVAVSNFETGLKFWGDILGLPLHHIEEVPSFHVKVAFLPVGESDIELLMPLNSDSAPAGDVESMSKGLDHLCLEVKDLAGVLVELKSKGVILNNDTPQVLPGRKLAFVDPRSTGGVLLEFYELTDTD